MKLSVSAYRAHASAHKKILDTAYQLNYGSTQASSTSQPHFKVEPICAEDPHAPLGVGGPASAHLAPDSGSDTPATSPRSPLNTSREEDDEDDSHSDCKSPRGGYNADGTKSNQRWMKLRTTVQLSSAIQKKPPLKREDSFLKRFSTRQIPETQETVEDTSSECGAQQTVTRRRRRPPKHPRTVVNPDENFFFYWLLILTICVLYNLWTLIVRQSFPELQNAAGGFWMTCDGISDVVFLLDVGVQLRTGYLEQGLMVYDSRKLAGHYLHSRAFLLDLGALCPLDLLQVRLGPQPMLRFPRFLKVYRAVNYYYMVESRTVWPNLWRVVNLIHILLILAHWFGCFYFLLSEAEGFQGDWVYPYRPGDYATLTRKYLGSLYWSTLTLTTIGDLPTPETNAERTVVSVDGPRSIPRRGLKSRLLQFNTNGGYVFTITSYLIGVFIFATIVGQVGNVITNRNANRLEFERLLDGAKTYMRHHKVPSGMKKRVLRWYDYSWSRGRIQGGGDINTALGLLPDKLKTELALHVNLSVLKKVTIFQECQPEFLHDLVLKMKAYIFTPGDSICRKGEVAREMFIIADGILEVLSEAGRVLTTMKAGDFFGEIGILNLDGLNKRTADVRSVGYSELFSLSREDVLAAMKDYPEAQEILQALGRKRLMEVRNSARQASRASSKHHRDREKPAEQITTNITSPDHNRTLVSKLKLEAKGLRNALRKSRARRSDESLELQPLQGGATPPKHLLKRMPRVRSDDQENDEPETTVSPLGAGLPLLSRLRLLKEKQDNEDRVTSPGSIVSPPGTAGLQPEVISESQTHEPEVIGAGLPLLQRLLLLKAKEDRVGSMSGPANLSGANSGGDRRSRSPSPALSPSQKSVPGKVSFRDRIFSVRASTSSLDQKPSHFDTSPLAPDVVRDTHVSIGPPDPQPLLQPSTSCDTDPWSRLQAAIKRDNTLEEEERNSNIPSKKKPNLLKIQSKTKFYESVDDLSPEYCGLPFVKKLKILNERQKLAELESAMKTRSVSLDIPDNLPYDDGTLTRSHSEASAMHKKNNRLTVEIGQGPTSPESNETPERRNLKSILKKLTEDAKPQKKEECRSELLRAPTIEGYAARHSKLAKSVTFDRETVSPTEVGPPSGPPGVPLMPPQQSSPLIPGLGVPQPPREPSPEPTSVQEEDVSVCVPIPEEKEEKEERKEEKVEEKRKDMEENSTQRIIKGLDEHEYFGTALLAIKQVISAHLQEMHIKFQARFDRLEAEVRSRDVVIGRLRQHIQDLERSLDDEYTGSDSTSTIIPRCSWDSPSNEESLELQELPESMRPQQQWGESVVLELDSTDTEVEDEREDEPVLHSGTWEFELLAEQMRRQTRSHSFDQAAPRRRLLCRGYSADHKD